MSELPLPPAPKRPPLSHRPDDRHPDRLRHPVLPGRLAAEAPGLEGRPAGPDRGAEDRPAQPLATVLARAKARTRPGPGSVTCSAGQAANPALVYGVRDGDIVWRATAICGTWGGPYGAILLDLGVVKALTGQSTPRPRRLRRPGPGRRRADGPQAAGRRPRRDCRPLRRRKPAPYILMVESATPFRPADPPRRCRQKFPIGTWNTR
jgi:hypothetical protein